MDKKEVQQRVLKDGKPLSFRLFSWSKKTKVFASEQEGLIIDFSNLDGYTFKTEEDCIFKTGNDCTFETEGNCVFKTGCNCTFNVGGGCIFDTEEDCVFKTGNGCIFETEENCIFKTGCNCTFNVGCGCIFDTESGGVAVRRDVYEVFELKEEQKIKLNDFGVKGFKVLTN